MRNIRVATRSLFSTAGLFLVYATAALSLGLAVPRESRAAGSASFLPPPCGLRARVQFWGKVFSRYSSSQVLIHDAQQPERVFSVLDFRSHKERLSKHALDRLIARTVAREKKRVARLLKDAAWRRQKGKRLTAEERRLLAAFPGRASPKEMRAAAQRLRAQKGLREEFKRGLQRSHRYLPTMRRIFRGTGLPEELAAIPLIESSFNPAARSRAGAAGVWQFMPRTGRQFMVIDNLIDERWDPIRSTRAAARLLKQNFETLKSWPLAITAYNHGRAGVARAVARTRSRDLTRIIRRYRGRFFGFASQNFYAEFLAALQVQRDYRRHFDEMVFSPPFSAHEIVLGKAIRSRDAARLAGVSRAELGRLNPALRPRLLVSNGWIPAGLGLWVPKGRAGDFNLGYARLPKSMKRRYPSLASLRRSGQGGQRVHRVRRGQTLSQIARIYGTSVAKIKRRNRIRNVHRIRAGQLLKIPAG